MGVRFLFPAFLTTSGGKKKKGQVCLSAGIFYVRTAHPPQTKNNLRQLGYVLPHT